MSVISSMMVTLLDDYDYHGITIRFSGDYTRMRIGGVDYQLPVFKIDNPNDLPYSMPTLVLEWADEELGNIGKLINLPDLRWERELLRFFNKTLELSVCVDLLAAIVLFLYNSLFRLSISS